MIKLTFETITLVMKNETPEREQEWVWYICAEAICSQFRLQMMVERTSVKGEKSDQF